jgi:spermidine/putrescine transport system permease protein
MNKHMYEAALDLGCHPARAFMKVVLPEIMPGIVTGALIAFTMSMDDFVISYFNSGSTAQTLSVTIYSMTKRRISPEINALSTIMFGTVLLLLLIVNIRQIRDTAKMKSQHF